MNFRQLQKGVKISKNVLDVIYGREPQTAVMRYAGEMGCFTRAAAAPLNAFIGVSLLALGGGDDSTIRSSCSYLLLRVEKCPLGWVCSKCGHCCRQAPGRGVT